MDLNSDTNVDDSQNEIYSSLSQIPLKVEKNLKGSLDSIPSPSPSLKIQIMGGKVCLRRKGKTLLGIVCQQAMFCLYTFPAHNLNFH